MRKNVLSIALLAIVINFASCGSKSSFESDVTKMGNYRCDIQKLMAKDQSDEKVKKQVEDLKKEMEAYADKMAKKYADKKSDKAMDEKADKIMKDIMDNCK